jgi:hypothetical protein
MSENSVVRVINHPEKMGKPSDVLRGLCKRKNVNAVYANVFNQLPHLRAASFRLVSYLTPYWPDPLNRSPSLLEACVQSVYTRANTMLKNEAELNDIQIMYIETIADELALSLRHTLMYRKKSLWLPFEPNQDRLEDIIAHDNILSLMWTNEPYHGHNSPESRLICASRVFTMTELESAKLIQAEGHA